MASPPTVPACWKPIVKQIPKQPFRATPADRAKAIGASLNKVVGVARTELNQTAGWVADLLAMITAHEAANLKQVAEITALQAQVERSVNFAKGIVSKVEHLEGKVQRQDDAMKETDRLNAKTLDRAIE
jgi:hypothetical protein